VGDRDLVLRKLADLDQYVSQVSEDRDIAGEQYRRDWKPQRSIERTLQLAIEVCVDIANQVIAAAALTAAGTQQTLTVPKHRELDRGTVQAIFRHACGFIPEDELHLRHVDLPGADVHPYRRHLEAAHLGQRADGREVAVTRAILPALVVVTRLSRLVLQPLGERPVGVVQLEPAGDNSFHKQPD
jgi:hypothetical protein